MKTLTESLSGVISGLHKTLRKTFSENTSFSLTELETISLIYRNENILPSELAVKTKITTPSMSQTLKKMESQGIIKRTPCKSDRRKVYVSLTPLGKMTVEEARSRKKEMLQELIETKLTEEEIAKLEQAVPVLKKLNS